MALIFSRKLLRPLEGTDIQSALNSALKKVSSALPLQGHEYVRALDNLFSIGLGPHKNYQRYKKTIDLITQAIDKLRTAQIRYFSASRGTGTRREGGPLSPLVRRRRALPDRVLPSQKRCEAVRGRANSLYHLTDHPYQMPLGFNVEDYVQDALMIMRGRRIEVELLFAKNVAAWIKDKLWHV